MSRLVICYKSLNRMTSLVKTSPWKTALRKTASLRLSMVAGRYYQKHALFDPLQVQGKHFVIRIRANTTKTIIKKNNVGLDSIVFFDAEALLGTDENKNQSQKLVRLVDYWIATDR